MNRELMEKIAKRKEDPNYPYGNKLGKGHVVKSGIGEIGSNIAIGTLAGTIPGASLGALVARPTKGALIGAGAGAALGIIAAPASYKSGKRAGEQYRYISYLPSNEQQALKKKIDILEGKQDAINEKQDEIYSKEYSNERSRDNARLQLRRYSQQFDALTEQRKELWNNAITRGKALMLEEKKNRRLSKKASDYLDEAVMEKEARAKIEYVAMGKNSGGKDCMRTVRLTRVEAKKFMKSRKLPVGNLVINRRNKKVYLVDDTGKRTKRHIGTMTSERAV